MPRKKRLRSSIRECVYCGKTGQMTPDHIPPKSLFLPPRPSNLITVASCEDCNGGSSRDDEYFKNVLMLRDGVERHPQAAQLREQVLESLAREKAQRFARSLYRDMSLVHVSGPLGLYLGQRVAIDVKLPRIRRVLNRIVRGLFHHERNERLPGDCLVDSWVDTALPDRRIMALLESQSPKTIGDGVFSYRSIFTDDGRYGSAWQFVFYEAVPVVSLTVPQSPAR
jgi:hypothetical protein